MKYSNPIIPGFYPDPSICRVGEDFYLVTSTFAYFPGVPIFHSRDLIHWQQIGHCLTRKSQLCLDRTWISGGIYAPTIRYCNGVFYMVTTNVSHGGNFYVTATDPAGDWSEPIWVEQGGIDPSLFFDDDGKVYFTSTYQENGKHGIGQSEIDITTGKLLTPTRLIWEGTGGRHPEAPHLYKINGLYYLMIAEGGTEYGHMVTIARSTSPWGVFEACPRNPILTHRNRGNCEIQGTGHADLIQAFDGSWWMVFLAFRITQSYFHHLGRETFLAPVVWDNNGWPVVNGNGTVDLTMDAECLPQTPVPEPPVRDDFIEVNLGYQWNFLRNPTPGTWDLEKRKGWLCLKCSAVSLDDADSPAFIGRRQQHFDCEVSAKLEFIPEAESEEAGIIVYYDNDHHYEIGVTLLGGAKQVIVRKRIGDLAAIVAREEVQDSQLIITVKADRTSYIFGYGVGEGEFRPLATGLTQYVSTEATVCSFTGVYLGLYATGNGRDSAASAYFDWFEYRPK